MLKKYVSTFVDAQIFMLQEVWKFSKSLFVYRSILAINSGIMPAVNALLSYYLVSAITSLLWYETLFWIAAGALINFGSHFLSSYIRVMKLAGKSDYFTAKLMVRFQAKVVNMDYELLFTPDMTKKREMATHMIYDNRISNYLDTLFSIISNVISLISVGFILTMVSPWIFVVLAVISIIRIYSIILERKETFNAAKEIASDQRKLSYLLHTTMDESYANDFRMYGVSAFILRKFDNILQRLHQVRMKLFGTNVKVEIVRGGLSSIETAVFYLFLAIEMIFFNMTFATFTMALTALRNFSSSVTVISNNLINIGENVVYVNEFKEFMEVKNIIADPDKGISIKEIQDKKSIYTFSDMSYKYPSNDNATLKNINLSLESNKVYVIVGENGAGKSTFVKLLCRLYDTSQGKILYNDKDIREINYKEYRDSIGIVFQDYKYYDFSIAENVAMNDYAETDTIRTRIYDSLVAVGLKEKIDSLPNGIDTPLGRAYDERGVLLSGGELQKLALARIIFSDPKIIILDEPSSALDAFAEDELMNLVLEKLKGKTIFYISHRMSIAKYADKVIFINNNTVEHVLPHNELLETSEKYAEMYNVQAKHYSEDL